MPAGWTRVEEDMVVRCYKRDVYGLEASLPFVGAYSRIFVLWGHTDKYMNNTFTWLIHCFYSPPLLDALLSHSSFLERYSGGRRGLGQSIDFCASGVCLEVESIGARRTTLQHNDCRMPIELCQSLSKPLRRDKRLCNRIGVWV